MFKESVGLVGGFGAYATLDFYERLLEMFATGFERDYPHIYMDNNFTMPSRTRALLYGEEYEAVVKGIADSLYDLLSLDVDYIILICGTAHAFLKDVYKIVPEAEEKVLNMLKILGEYLEETMIERAVIVAAEGTLEKGIYESNVGINCINPGPLYYEKIRYFIESIKQNKVDEETYIQWIEFLKNVGGGVKTVVLGCTEFPVLVNKLKKYDLSNELGKYEFIDPLELVLRKLKNIIR